MDNLINFEENDNKVENSEKPKEPTRNTLLLVKDRLSFELNNPFDKLEYHVTHSDDPFECLETRKMNKPAEIIQEKPVDDILESLLSGKLRSDVHNSTDPSPISSAMSSFVGETESSTKSKSLKRCQSDSDSKTVNGDDMTSKFSSVDNILASKTNQLLKLSLLNSPRSPLHSSSRVGLDGSLIDSVFQEAKKISEKLSSYNEMSFEDLNNISQHLIDSSLRDDLEQLKISFLENNPETTTEQPSKIESMDDIQEKLMKIKLEKCIDEKEPEVIEIKEEKSEESSSTKPAAPKAENEIDDILLKIKELMKGNKKEEAKKHLNKLSELMGPSEPKSLLQVQPIIRQDTFEIDTATGRRKYSNNLNISNNSSEERNSSVNSELIEQISKLLGTQNLDVNSLNLSGNGGETKVFIIQTPAATPVKQNISSRRSVSFSTQRPSTSMKGIENKKLSTPMKPTTAIKPNARRSSFTAPRPLAKPLDQKLNIGTVRKSLMGSMDKSPIKMNVPHTKPPVTRPPPAGSNVRRSVSLKNNIPSLKVSEASPSKNRPSTMAAPLKIPPVSVSRSSSVQNRRLSTLSTRPSTTEPQRGVNLATNRSLSRKTEIKPTSKISSAKESLV